MKKFNVFRVKALLQNFRLFNNDVSRVRLASARRTCETSFLSVNEFVCYVPPGAHYSTIATFKSHFYILVSKRG